MQLVVLCACGESMKARGMGKGVIVSCQATNQLSIDKHVLEERTILTLNYLFESNPDIIENNGLASACRNASLT